MGRKVAVHGSSGVWIWVMRHRPWVDRYVDMGPQVEGSGTESLVATCGTLPPGPGLGVGRIPFSLAGLRMVAISGSCAGLMIRCFAFRGSPFMGGATGRHLWDQARHRGDVDGASTQAMRLSIRPAKVARYGTDATVPVYGTDSPAPAHRAVTRAPSMGRPPGGRLWDGSGSARNPKVVLRVAAPWDRWPAMGQLGGEWSPTGPIGDRLWAALLGTSVKGLHFRAASRLSTGSTVDGRPGKRPYAGRVSREDSLGPRNGHLCPWVP
jgi:hypothetical protein